jgi:WD40-like Beta Propeller Repeat
VLALSPDFGRAAPVVNVASVHVLLTRVTAETVVLDTVIHLAVGADSVDLTVTVNTAPNVRYVVFLELDDEAGQALFTGGPMEVTPVPIGSTVEPIVLPLVWVGIGANATQVRIVALDTLLFPAEERTLMAEALDASGAPIPGTPIVWRSLRPTFVDVPDPATGRVVAGAGRGAARIVASLLTGQEDTTTVIVQLPPSALQVLFGGGQTGIINSQLPAPIQVELQASDGIGVRDVWLRYTPSGGGVVTPDSALTNLVGRAIFTWSLGSTVGAQSVVVMTTTQPLISTTVNASAVGPRQVVRWVNPSDGNWSDPANWSDGIGPTSSDSVMIDLPGTYTVTVDVDVTVRALVVVGAGTGAQAMEISGHSVSSQDGLVLNGGGTASLTLRNGSYQGPGPVTIAAGLVGMLDGSTINAPVDLADRLDFGDGVNTIVGPVTTQSSSMIKVAPATAVASNAAFGTALTVQGTLDLTSDVNAAAVLTVTGGPLTIAPSGSLTSQAGQGGARSVVANLINQGSLVVDQDLTVTTGSSGGSNSGSINLVNGDLIVDLSPDGSLVSSGDITTGAGTTVRLQNGSFAYDAGNITGDGGVDLTNVTAGLTPDLTVGPYSLNLIGSTLNGPGILTVASGASLSATGSAFNLDLSIQGNALFSGNPVVLNGVITTGSSSIVSVYGVPGGSDVTVASGITVGGTMFIGSSSSTESVILRIPSGALTVAAGASLLTTPANVGSRTIVGDLVAQGSLSITGDLALQGGSFTMAPGSGLNGSATLDLTAATGSVFDGEVVPGGVTPAILSIAGDFPQGTGSTIWFDMAGTTPGTGYDQVNVSGTATILGTILINPTITPQPGDVFTLMTFGSRGPGAVTALAGPLDFIGAVLDTVWTATSLAVEASAAVVFAGDSAGGLSSGVFRATPSGGRWVRVSPEGANGDVYPRWSPDRSRIVFNRQNPLDLSNELYMVSGDGTETAAVVADTSSRRARFNSTGQRVAFECGDGFSAIQDVCVIANVTGPVSGLAGAGNGGAKTYVTAAISPSLPGSGAFAWDPTNPDDLMVVRDSLLNGQRASQLWRVRYDGTAIAAQIDTVLATPGGDTLMISSVDWSEDGSYIAFAASDQTGTSSIYRYDIGGAITQLTFPPPVSPDQRPVISPDGSEILFARSSDGFELYRVARSGGAVTAVTPLFNHSISQAGWDWSPDGRYIVLTDDTVPSAGVVVVRVLAGTSAASFLADRVVVGRVGVAFEVQDRQPSWRP